MSYGIRHRDDGVFVVYRSDLGDVVDHSRSRKAAKAAIQALRGEGRMRKRRG